MTLKELFDSAQFSGCVTIVLVEDGVEYKSYDGYSEFTVRNCSGALPQEWFPYAENKVGKVYPRRELFPKSTPDEDGKYRCEDIASVSIQVFAKPSDDLVVFGNTGGNIYCGWCKVDDGWFMGGENSCGGVWKTYSQANEGYLDEDCGFIRDVISAEELRRIWTHIYTTMIECGSYEADYCRECLARLDEDLANDPDVI